MPTTPMMPLMAPFMPQSAEPVVPAAPADPDLEWLTQKVRQARMREELSAAGIDPDNPGMTLPEFGRHAAIELGMSLVPALRLFPRATGLAAGLGAFFGGTSEAGSADDGVKQLQQQLKDAGYYQGPIDGKMGPMTQAAQQRFEQDRMRREQAEAERMRAQAEAERVRFEREQAEREAAQRAAGEKRMREMEENVSPVSRAIRDYGPAVGFGLGVLTGGLTRGKMARTYSRASEEAAQRSNRLISGEGDLPSRIGGVNQFWQEGGAAAVPFSPAPAARAGVRPNPDAPSATKLYQTPRISEFARVRDVVPVGGFLGEAAVSSHFGEQARRELREAYEAAERDPSEANINRLQAAMDRAAIFDTMGRFGLGAAFGFGAGAAKARYRTTRPDVGAAEAERIRIDQLLRGRGGSSATSAQAVPPPAPLGVPHHSSLQPRKNGRFAGPPKYPKGDPRRKQ